MQEMQEIAFRVCYGNVGLNNGAYKMSREGQQSISCISCISSPWNGLQPCSYQHEPCTTAHQMLSTHALPGSGPGTYTVSTL